MRNLATNFGFSLALAIAPTAISDHPEEPPAKRRKSAHIDVETRASKGPADHQEVSAAQKKPKVRRKFENVKEDEAPILRDEGPESFASTIKKRGRPKKTPVHIEVEEVPVPTAVPERRPRRNAAASALAKVTEGFAEEAQPIDKKRRDPEPEKPARKGRKKAACVVTTEPESIDSIAKGEPKEELPIGSSEERKPARPAKRKPKSKTAESPKKRVPLGETHANIPSRSPEKRAKAVNIDGDSSRSPRSQGMRTEPKVKATNDGIKQLRLENEASNDSEKAMALAVTSKHSTDEKQTQLEPSASPPKQFKERDSNRKGPSTAKPRAKATGKPTVQKAGRNEEDKTSQDCGIVAVECEESCLPPSSVKQSKVSPPTPLEKATIQQELKLRVSDRRPKDGQVDAPCSQPQDPSGGTARAKKHPIPPKQKAPQKSKRADAAQSKDRVKPPELDKNSKEDEDVDWLFETNEKRKVPPRQSKRKAPAKVARRAQSPEVDLDEMLSNIASWAPKGR